MELYIDKEFIDALYLSIDLDNLTRSQRILLNIFRDYGEVDKFINFPINTFEELESLKTNNILIAQLCEYHPVISVQSLQGHLNDNSKYEQTIILTYNSEEWIKDAEKKGALCFTFKNYQSKIEEIIEELHFKIDLSEPFQGWGVLNRYSSLNYNKISIIDKYILFWNDTRKVEDNLLPILKKLCHNKEKMNVSILTFPFNKHGEPKYKKEKTKKRYKLISSKLEEKLSDLKITMFDYDNDFDFHDRIIHTNFSILECGKGFLLKGSKPSNSTLISETIFDKFTYNRLKNIKKRADLYIGKQYKKQKDYEFRKKNGTVPFEEFHMFPLQLNNQ